MRVPPATVHFFAERILSVSARRVQLSCCWLESGAGMKAPERQLKYSSFLHRLRSATTRILLLDYDGTLAPFTADSGHGFPYSAVSPLLGRIMAEGTRVALISGRPA